MLHQKVCNVYLRTSPVAYYQGHSIALVSRSQTTPLRYATRATNCTKCNELQIYNITQLHDPYISCFVIV